MNTRERFVRTLLGRDVDRVPFIKVFGVDNMIVPAWEAQRPGIGKEIDALLGFEGTYRGWAQPDVNVWLSSLPPSRRIEDDERHTIWRHGDGSVTIEQKGADYHGRVLEWAVKDRHDWDRLRSRHLDPADPTRLPADWPDRVARYAARDYPLQLTHSGVYGFARNLMGDEALGYAFYDEPALVHDIMDTYTDAALAIWERLTAQVDFDLIECWEDMACKTGSIISPATFDEFMRPNYRKIADFAAAHGIEIVLVDSDGNIEDLTGWMLSAGVTALYPYEVQAGNDAAAMLERYPRLGVIGGLNKNVMAAGRAAIDAEMDRARALIRRGRFIPGPDHFVLSDVTFADSEATSSVSDAGLSKLDKVVSTPTKLLP
ncbi:MAG: hypothetical protein NTV86_21280 [Planctomycetota bacterium]|nr:hypothetical protein [Planctomycetota bacterium]